MATSCDVVDANDTPVRGMNRFGSSRHVAAATLVLGTMWVVACSGASIDGSSGDASSSVSTSPLRIEQSTARATAPETTASTVPSTAPLCVAAGQVRDLEAGVSSLVSEVLAASSQEKLPDADAITVRVVADLRTLDPAARAAYRGLAAALPQDLQLDEKNFEKANLYVFDHLGGVASLADFKRLMTDMSALMGDAAGTAASVGGTKIDRYTQRLCGISVLV